jgi:hypothetical protein
MTPWGENDRLILCGSVALSDGHHDGALVAHCEMCQTEVWAGPASVEKAKESNWHLICRECAAVLRSLGVDMIVGGRYSAGGPVPWKWEGKQ